MKKIISFLLACVILSSCFAFSAVKAEEELKDAGGFFPGWGHKYQLNKAFDAAPQTFEAVIYMPAEYFTIKNGEPGVGGTILGSYNGRGGSERFAIEYGVPVLFWHDDYLSPGYNRDDFIFNAKFDDVNIADYARKDENGFLPSTINITIVRDYEAKELRCYINGEQAGKAVKFADVWTNFSSSSSVAEPDLSKLAPISAERIASNKYVIGGDNRSMNSNYFRGATNGNDGSINRIALYSDVRTAAEIKADYDNIGKDTSNLIAYFDFSKFVPEGATLVKTPAEVADVTGTYVAKRDIRNVAAPSKGEFTHSIAVVGDTQILIQEDNNNGNTVYSDILYGWIADNIDSSKIAYMVGVGDITNKWTNGEYETALNALSNNIDGKLPYILARGNHDKAEVDEGIDWGGILEGIFGGGSSSGNTSKEIGFEEAMDGSYYDNSVIPATQRMNGELRNCYTTANINGTHYLFLSLDCGASDNNTTTVNGKTVDNIGWAASVIEAHPNHNVIITTHAYLNYDGEHLVETSYTAMDYSTGTSDDHYNNGDEIWSRLVSKYENICMVLSGHIGTDHVVATPRVGENGNTVIEILTDHQDVDNKGIAETGAPLGIVTMLYFMGDGKTVNVETISTVRAASSNVDTSKAPYYYESNQFSFALDLCGTTGDVNNDGVTDASDVIKMVSEYINPTDAVTFCDQTGDGKISLIDILRVVKATL